VTRFRVSASPRIFDAPRGTPRRRRSTTADARRDARDARRRGFATEGTTSVTRPRDGESTRSIDGDRAID
jgi:hypothetical protein